MHIPVFNKFVHPFALMHCPPRRKMKSELKHYEQTNAVPLICEQHYLHPTLIESIAKGHCKQF